MPEKCVILTWNEIPRENMIRQNHFTREYDVINTSTQAQETEVSNLIQHCCSASVVYVKLRSALYMVDFKCNYNSHTKVSRVFSKLYTIKLQIHVFVILRLRGHIFIWIRSACFTSFENREFHKIYPKVLSQKLS